LEAVAATLPKADLTHLVTTPAAPPTGWNAQLKTPNPTPRPGATAPRPGATTPRPQARTPTGPQARPATPSGAAQSRQSISQPPPSETSSTLAPPRNQTARNVVLALLALALVGGGAWLLIPHGGKTTQIAQNPTPSPLPPLPPPAPVLPPPTPPKTIEVIVDSTPTGAKIVRDGVVTAETPEALSLTGPVTVVIRKDGYAEKSVTIDPAATHKLVVKLERAKVVASKTPARPPTKTEPPKTPTKVATAPKPGEPVDPYATPTPKTTAAPPPKPPTPPVATPPKTHDELSGRLEKSGGALVAGGHRVGAIYRGAAANEGGRSDWFVPLEGGHCYTFVGEGGDGVKKLFLYLWGPAGRRLQSTREDTPHAKMSYCTAFPGTYHVQAKVDDGQGEYRFGIYSK
ncbi:MAG: PEGA domain-containing protein, partial [Polyangia bacterium]